MKEFYVLNLDMRRIAIVAGGALFALGLALTIGMAIGRGQGERAARVAAEEAQSQKLGLAPEPAKVAPEPTEKLVVAQGPSSAKAALSERPVPEAVQKGEIELREDPLVQGPPKKKQKFNKLSAKLDMSTDEAPAKQPKKKKALAKAESGDAEVSGKINHGRKLARKTVREDDEEAEERPKKRIAKRTNTSDEADSAASGIRYTIQVAAFKRSGDAGTLIEKLKGEGIKAQTQKSGDFYLVTVGRSKSKEKLSKALSRLKELEYDAYIRKLKPASSDT